MILNLITQDTTPQPGDYYGTVYKGSFLIPLLIIGITLAVVIGWFYRKRKR